MIVKFKSHKRTNYKNVANYILSGFYNDKDSFAIFHNVSSTDVREVAKEFIENNKLKPKRKNGVVLRHGIQSYSALDSENLTVEKVKDLAQKFIEVMYPDNLVVAGLHQDAEHIHVHFMISANAYLSSKASRFSKKELRERKIALERYQVEKYQEIEHSIVFLEEKKKGLNQGKTKKSKTGRESIKEFLKTLLKETFENAKGLNEFFEKLKEKELETYKYRGKLTGIWHENNKYKFKTLGIQPEHLKTLERMDDINRISQKSKEKSNDLER